MGIIQQGLTKAKETTNLLIQSTPKDNRFLLMQLYCMRFNMEKLQNFILLNKRILQRIQQKAKQRQRN